MLVCVVACAVVCLLRSSLTQLELQGWGSMQEHRSGPDSWLQLFCSVNHNFAVTFNSAQVRMCHNVVRVVLVHLNQGRGKRTSANTTGSPSSASNATKSGGSDACGSDACGLSIPTAATSCSTTSCSCYLAWRWRCSALVFGVSVFLQSYLAEASVLEMFLQTASDIAKAPVPYLGEPAMSC